MLLKLTWKKTWNLVKNEEYDQKKRRKGSEEYEMDLKYTLELRPTLAMGKQSAGSMGKPVVAKWSQ